MFNYARAFPQPDEYLDSDELNRSVGGGVLCPWLLSDDAPKAIEATKNARYNLLRAQHGGGKAINKYQYQTEVLASNTLINRAQGDKAIWLMSAAYIALSSGAEKVYMQSAISMGRFKSSLDRYSGISNLLSYDLLVNDPSIEGTYAMTPSPRFRSSILVPYELGHKLKASNEQLKHETQINIVELLYHILESYGKRDFRLCELLPRYRLPRPILFQTLVNQGCNAEGHMIDRKDEAIYAFFNRQAKRNFLNHVGSVGASGSGGNIRDKFMVIATNHSLNLGAVGKFNNFFANNRLFKSNHSIWELKYMALVFSNYVYAGVQSGEISRNSSSYIAPYLKDKNRYHKLPDENAGGEYRNLRKYCFIAQMLNIYSHSMHVKLPSRREMLSRAAYEMLIVLFCGGIVQSSCKSGKDREGLLNVFIDTILIYVDQKGACPDLSKKEVQNDFAQVFSDLFYAGNVTDIAAMNALYAYGIKNLHGILPEFLQKELQKNIHYKAIKKSAKLNKVKPEKLVTDNNNLYPVHKLSREEKETLRNSILSRDTALNRLEKDLDNCLTALYGAEGNEPIDYVTLNAIHSQLQASRKS
ncbi:hypothetical protein IB691_01165 [Fangia hongkongensis]|nr:hypothetical protein [Fangia hongkongensis]